MIFSHAKGVCVRLAILAFLLLVAEIAAAAPLPDGSRMVFLGDSITEQCDYTRYVMDYFALRYPDLNITFRNAGLGGGTAVEGLERLERDVLSQRPTVVTICFGMNDGGCTTFEQERYEGFLAAMTRLVQTLKGRGIQVVLLTPGPVDEDRGLQGYNATLARYAEGVIALASQEQVAVCNIHTLMAKAQTQAKQDNPQYTMIADSVHPDAPGHALMAYGLLLALGATEPAASVSIDAVTGQITTDRATISDLTITSNAITFSRTDRALPTHFDPEAYSIFPYVPVQSTLNRYPFQVTGLSAGTWKLTVEGVEVGAFSADKLTEGVDLGTLPGPWQALGKQVDATVQVQEAIYLMRWKYLGVLLEVPKTAQPEKLALEQKLDQLIAEQEAARRELTAPQALQWSLTWVQ
jgi:lysophospholipase L1-like esterase